MKPETEDLFGLSEQDLLIDEARRVAYAAGFRSCLNAAGLLEERRVVVEQRGNLLKVYQMQEVDPWSSAHPYNYESARRFKNPPNFREWLTKQSVMTEGRISR
jgi:hypothetical protein